MTNIISFYHNFIIITIKKGKYFTIINFFNSYHSFRLNEYIPNKAKDKIWMLVSTIYHVVYSHSSRGSIIYIMSVGDELISGSDHLILGSEGLKDLGCCLCGVCKFFLWPHRLCPGARVSSTSQKMCGRAG